MSTSWHPAWLAVPKGRAEGGSLVVAERKGQIISIKKVEKVGRLVVRLDDRMADMDQPVTVEQDGKTLFLGKPSRTIQTLVQTLADRGDPRLMFDAEVEVDLADSVGGKPLHSTTPSLHDVQLDLQLHGYNYMATGK